MARRLAVVTSDLMFRARLRSVAAQAGAELVEDAAAGALAVLELKDARALEQIETLVRRGVDVLAFGPHTNAELLRRARAAGAEAVPNSQVTARLRALLAS